MSFAYNPVQPVATGSTVASAPVNLGFSQIAGAFNQHQTGAAYSHSVTSGAGGVNVGAAIQGTTAASTGATDLWTMIDRLANAVGVLAVGSSAAGSWTTLGNISGAGSGLNGATSLATALAVVRRDGSGGAAFGPLSGTNVIGVASDLSHAGVYARGASGDPSQFIFAVQNNSGSVNDFTVSNLGDAVARGKVTATDHVASGVYYAGSGVVQVTDSAGLIRTAALPIVDRIHGGFGLDMTNSANFATVRSTYSLAASGSNADITALTGLTTALSPAVGGTGLINPTAGSIPVTNGSGNYQLLPPTPANYFVVSNGTTYVAQAFATSMIPSGTLNQSVMSALYPSPGVGGGNLLKAQAAPWAGYINGTWVSFAGGVGNYSPAIDPTGIGLGQSRIDLLVLNAAGNLAWSVGTPSATPSIAATPLPSNAAPIWYVKVYNGATSITGYTDTGSQAAFIQDARNLFGPTTAVASGGASTLLTYATMGNETAGLANSVRIGNKFFVTIGNDADFTAETDVFTLASGTTGVVNSKDLALFRVNPSRIGVSTTGAVLGDMIFPYVSPNVSQLLVPGTGANLGKLVWNVTAQSGPVVIATSADIRRVDVNSAAGQLVTTNAATAIGGGAAALMSVIGDPTTASVSYFNTTLQLASSSVPAGMIEIARLWWDGTAFYNTVSGGMHFSALPTLGPGNIRNIRNFNTQAPTANLPIVGTQTALPGWTPFVIHVPVAGLSADCEIAGLGTMHAARTMNLYLYVGYSAVVNGGSNAGPWTLAGNPAFFGSDIPLNTAGQRSKHTRVQGLPAGDVWFTLLYILAGTTADTWPSMAWAELDVKLES